MITDEGIEKGLENLTSNKSEIQNTINKVLTNEIGARFQTYIKGCIHCGLCSNACHIYLSEGKDPNFSPVGKIKRTLWEMISKKGRVDTEFLRQAVKIAHTECNLCRRCVLYCPMGIDTAYLITVVRRIVHKLGITPLYIQDTAHSHSVHINQMWVKEDEWIDTLQWQEEEAQSEIPKIRIPLDKEGAQVMYSVIAPEPKFQAGLIYKAAVIMHVAKVDWTVPSGIGWDNSDMTMFTGDYEIMGRLKKVHYETAAQLKVEKIVMGECGHAFRSVYDMGNRWLSWAMPPIPVIHAVEFYYDLIKSGAIEIVKKYDKPVTLHDPCNISRGKGLHEKARYIVEQLCTDFVEMYPNREFNYCCSAGGGVINCGPPHKKTRINSSKIKAKQLFDTKVRGAETVIAPCHNCHSGLEDVVNFFGIKLEIKFFTDLIYECMLKPDSQGN